MCVTCTPALQIYTQNTMTQLTYCFVINQWRIQDSPQGGAPTPKIAIIFQIFAENCMKMKEFGPGGGPRPWRPALDPPMLTIINNVINRFVTSCIVLIIRFMNFALTLLFMVHVYEVKTWYW